MKIEQNNLKNKNIFFTEPINNMDDFILTSIPGVYISTLNDTVIEILKNNEGVLFDTIYYSNEDRILYFYTNKSISLNEYYKRSRYIKKNINTNSDILEETKKVLTMDKNREEDCISLYEVAKYLKIMHYRYEAMLKDYKYNMEEALYKNFITTDFRLYDFDYDKNELVIGYGYNYPKIKFTKYDGDLYITSSESYKDNEAIVILGKELSSLYDECMKYKNYIIEKEYFFNSVNSNFKVSVSHDGASVSSSNRYNSLKNDFKLSHYVSKNDYVCDSNSYLLTETLKEHENEIFKSIFVRIDDLPSWCKSYLKEIRKNELDMIEKEENKVYKKEINKQKRLELGKKISIWIIDNLI